MKSTTVIIHKPQYIAKERGFRAQSWKINWRKLLTFADCSGYAACGEKLA